MPTPILALRVDVERKAHWKTAADRCGRDLSDFIRRAVDAAAEKEFADDAASLIGTDDPVVIEQLRNSC